MPLTSGELIELVAKLTDVPAKTVALHARNLRLAGRLTTGGRGPSAPHMTTADAARLLIATAMSDLVLQSVETIQMADSLRSGIPELSGKEHYFLDHNPGRPSSGALFANSCRRLLFTTFGEAVKNLIEAAGQTNPLLLEVYTDSGQPYEIMHPGILVLAKMVPEKGKRVIRSANIVLGYGSEFEIKADYVIPKSMRLRRHDVHSHLKRTEELDEFPIMKLGSALISAVSETPG